MRIRTVLSVTAVAAGALIAAACGVLSASSVEQPDYSVVGQIGRSVEIRSYPDLLAAEVTVPAGPEARNQAFRLLFRYIDGANQPAENIAMTAPVEVADGTEIAMTAPVETRDGPDSLTMRFFLPASFAPETAPTPTDDRVRLVTVPAQSVAVLRFSGSRSPETLDTRRRLLVATVDGAQDWTATGPATAYLYDPPWTPSPMRRNEVVVPVVSVSEP